MRNPHFFNKVNDIPLSYKFMSIYLFCVLIPIISINILFFERISHNIKARELQNLEISLDRAKKDINGLIEGAVAISHAVATDRIMYEALDKKYGSPVDFYDAYNSLLKDKVNHYMPVNKQIEQISVYTTNESIQSGGNYFKLDESVRKSEWYNRLFAAGGKVLLYAYRDAAPYKNNYYIPHFSIISRLEAFDDASMFAKVLKIDLNLNKFYDVIVRERDYIQMYLINEKNQIVVSSIEGYQMDKNDAYTTFERDRLDRRKDSMLFDMPLGGVSYTSGWRLVGLANTDRMTNALKESRSFIILLAAASTLITSVLTAIMLRSYYYRVKRLSRHMEKVKNEKFDLIELHEGRDEIGELIRNFNRMTSKINSLINDVYKLEIQKKDLELERIRAELNFLQSQMNPHFLFNTLNAILVVCTRNHYTDVTEIIKSLSKILRRLLSWKDDLVSLQEEVLFTEMYLKIEKFRFGDKFSYHFAVDEEAFAYKIPKMSLQPLVENACKHGLQTIKSPGMIHISIRLNDDKLKVSITDNGIGMDSATIKKIMINMTSETEVSGNIGIRNVYRRLKLYYEERVRFDIASTPSEGTEIFFEIPLMRLTH
ncbi:sensor histidine kinase [Paenibacillus sedimenti]|nr:sensor histidine kinase [Paenibacillus sedimenti]